MTFLLSLLAETRLPVSKNGTLQNCADKKGKPCQPQVPALNNHQINSGFYISTGHENSREGPPRSGKGATRVPDACIWATGRGGAGRLHMARRRLTDTGKAKHWKTSRWGVRTDPARRTGAASGRLALWESSAGFVGDPMWGAALCPKSGHPPNKARLPEGASHVQTVGVTTQSSRPPCPGPPGLGGWPLLLLEPGCHGNITTHTDHGHLGQVSPILGRVNMEPPFLPIIVFLHLDNR